MVKAASRGLVISHTLRHSEISRLHIIPTKLHGLAPMKVLRIAKSKPIIKRYSSISNAVNATRPLLERETHPHYKASEYYPVHLNQIFRNRYKVAAKHGYRGSSTVWLCEDMMYIIQAFSLKIAPEHCTVIKSYKTLKVGICEDFENREPRVRNYLSEKSQLTLVNTA